MFWFFGILCTCMFAVRDSGVLEVNRCYFVSGQPSGGSVCLVLDVLARRVVFCGSFGDPLVLSFSGLC